MFKTFSFLCLFYFLSASPFLPDFSAFSAHLTAISSSISSNVLAL